MLPSIIDVCSELSALGAAVSVALNLNPGFCLSGYTQVTPTVQLVNTYALTNDCDLNYIFSCEKVQQLSKATQFQVSKRFKLSLHL